MFLRVLKAMELQIFLWKPASPVVFLFLQTGGTELLSKPPHQLKVSWERRFGDFQKVPPSTPPFLPLMGIILSK